jgi:hypothetical protein
VRYLLVSIGEEILVLPCVNGKNLWYSLGNAKIYIISWRVSAVIIYKFCGST